MMNREGIRPDRVYWVIPRKRKDDTQPTLALMTGEMPSLNIRPLHRDSVIYDATSDFDFLGEADMSDLFECTFKGLTLADLCGKAEATV